MNIEKNIKSKLTQTNNKGNLTLTIELTKEQRNLFLLEKGTAPQNLFKIIIKEVKK